MQPLNDLEALQLGVLVTFDDLEFLFDHRLWFLGSVLAWPKVWERFGENAFFAKCAKHEGAILHRSVDQSLAFKARERAFAQERHQRSIRRQHHQTLINRSVQYRSLVLGTFGEESVLSKTLPYLWPRQDRTKKPKPAVEQKLEVVEGDQNSELQSLQVI